MKEINDKFDKAETYVERLSKLILKVVTTLAALVVGVLFAWNQIKTTINEHVHQEDEEFQEYLKEIETEEGYNGYVDSTYEDSLYMVYYNLNEDSIIEGEIMDTTIIDTSVIDTIIMDTIIEPIIDTTITDTISDPIIDTITIDTIEVIE